MQDNCLKVCMSTVAIVIVLLVFVEVLNITHSNNNSINQGVAIGREVSFSK